jgi:hypothetical protein
MVLIIGYTAIAAVLILVGVDVSKVFLAQRALASAADAAALAASQGVDTSALDAGPGPACGAALPLDPQQSAQLAAQSLDAERASLDHTFASLGDPVTQAGAGTVKVSLSGEVAVPFGRVLGWLDPSRGNGLVHVSESSYAQSPVAGTGC